MITDDDMDRILDAFADDARMEAVTLALAAVQTAMRDRPTDRQGAGVIRCPACGGVLRYAFVRRPGGMRNGQGFVGRCDTDRCLTFRGH